MKRITGIQRAKLVIEWIKRGRESDVESFIKRVCEAKGMVYVPPIKAQR